MDTNNLNIKTIPVCRTCMEEITNTSFFHLDFMQVDGEPTIRQKLSNCIPELDLSIIPNTVICVKCADTINSLYVFKKECLQLEMKICEYIQEVHHAGNGTDLAATMQFHQHSTNFTAYLTTEAFEKTDIYKNEESTSFCDNYAFNDTEKYTEIENKEYLTTLQMVDKQCVLFNIAENFIDSVKSEAEENSDIHEDNNIVQDCLLQVAENRDSSIQNLHKTNIYYRCFTCGDKTERKVKLIQHLKTHNKKLYQKSISSKTLLCWYRCDLCNYSTKYKCLFSFHNAAHLTKKNYQRILKSNAFLVNPSTSTIAFGKKDGKDNKIKCIGFSSTKHNLKYWGKSLCSCKYSESKQHSNQCNTTKLAIDTNIIVKPCKCGICKICGYSTRYKRNKCRMLTHTGEKSFKCSLCEFNSNYKHSLKIHMLTHTGEKPFKCSVCDHSFKAKHHLKNHMLTHTGEKPFMCSVCDHSFNQKGSLKIHLLTHTGEKPFMCSLCEFSCNHKNTLKNHMLTHTGEKPFKCSICDHSFNQKGSLKIHLLTHTGEKPFKCSLCEFSCSRKNSLKMHLLTHTGEKLFKCLICGFSCNRKNRLKSHILIHTNEKPFKCSLCEFSCNKKNSLKSHILIHTGEKPFKCSLCEFSYNYKNSLKNHMLSHTGEKPFKCSVCDHSFNQKGSLKIHLLTHTGAKPFKCLLCEFSCNQKNSLRIHMLTHTGEKPFKCSVCDLSCNRKYSLKIHLLTHTGEKPFKCSLCEFSCNRKNSLKSHMLTHTGENPFKCSVCDYSFKQKGGLKMHLLTHTGEKPFKCSVCEYSCNFRHSLKRHMRTHNV